MQVNASDKITRQEALKLISKSSIYGNLGLFIGAGMSMAVLNSEWSKIALSWKELIYECAKEFDIDIKSQINTEGLSYPEIATEVAKLIAKSDHLDYKMSVNKLKEKIAELTSWYPESENRIAFGKLLENLNPNWIITTNYDLIIECLLTGKCLSLGPNDQLISPRKLIPIYHLHGIRTDPDSIIISQEDYISLFRPNQYRQQKLSLSIKESTTLIIGYGLGDVNVLTAVDWTKNVYSNQRIIYPHDIIQLLYKDNPEPEPYRDRNEILVIEFSDLKSILEEISSLIKADNLEEDSVNMALIKVNELYKLTKEEDVKQFIDDHQFRKKIIYEISVFGVKLISGFLELFSKAIDETWDRSNVDGAFQAYDQNLIILLDIIEYLPLAEMPPALFESIVYNLERVGNFIGDTRGKSHVAFRTWNRRKSQIPTETLTEIRNIARVRNYYKLERLLS